MGILNNDAIFLHKCKLKYDIDFEDVLTLGHQTLYVEEKVIKKLALMSNIEYIKNEFKNEIYSDNFLKKYLSISNLSCLDVSNYENCNVVHDMNFPIGPENYEKYSVLIDGGALEHIFNFPIAIENCLKMIKPGGSFFSFTMANNHCGHGFYQFSPELFFNYLKLNGFSVSNIILYESKFPGSELSQSSIGYKVVDPAVLQSRVGLVNRRPVNMMVHAIKGRNKGYMQTNYPIQSDYQPAHLSGKKENQNNSILKKIINTLPVSISNKIKGIKQLYRYSLANDKFYIKINLYDL